MKKIFILLFVFILGNIANTYAQARYVLEYNVDFKHPSGRYYVHEAFYETDLGIKVILPEFKIYQEQNDINRSGKIYIPAANGFIREVVFEISRQHKVLGVWFNNCNAHNETIVKTSAGASCFNIDGKAFSWSCFSTTFKKFNCYPDLYISKNKSVMTESEKLVIQATADFPARIYKWKYSFVDPQSPTIYNWQTVPASCFTNDIFEASAVDLLGLDGALNAAGKNIFFCIDLGCGKYSNLQDVSIKITTPGIESLTPENVKCPGESNGGMLITLDRELYPGETIGVYKEGSGIFNESVEFDIIDRKTIHVKDLWAGTYAIKLATSYNGVSLEPKSNAIKSNIVIQEPIPVSFSLAQKQMVSCNGGNNGSFKVQATGGTPAYKLMWRIAESNDNYTETDNMEVSGLVAGVYKFYIVDSNGCLTKDNEGFINTKTVEITEPNPLVLTLLDDKTSNPSGSGLSNGFITVQVNGGKPNGAGYYTVVWKNNDTHAILTTVENSIQAGIFESKLKNIPAGDYTITVTDANECASSIAQITIEEPFTIKGTIVQTQNIACYGDNNAALEITSLSGGVPATTGNPYILEWYEFVTNTDSTYIGGQTSITNLNPGRYVVSVSDFSTPQNQKNFYYTVTQPDTISVTVSHVNISCYNGNNGSISINVSGGTAPYHLYYAKGSDAYSVKESNSNLVLNNLTAGIYSFYLIDNNGCKALINGNYTETVAITQPATTFTISSERIKHPTGAGRSDGRIILKIIGGIPFAKAPIYNVVWNGPGTVSSVETIDGNGLFTTTLDNLPQGVYTVQINGDTHPGASGPCTLNLQFTLEEPKPLSVQWTVNKVVSCNGTTDGTITATVSGGIPNEDPSYLYQYVWYKVVNGRDELIPGAAEKTLSNLGAGQYKLTITDYGDPVNIKDFFYTLTEPAILSVSVSATPVSCFNGNNGVLKVNVTGGTSPYSFFYKKTEDEDYIELTSAGGSFTVNNMESGDYAVYVKDKNDCSVSINGNPIETVSITQPEKALSLVSQIIRGPSGNNRADGYITLKINGGTPFSSGPLYEVVWRNEYGYVISANNTMEGDTLVTTVKELPKGDYSVEVKDKMYYGTTGGCYFTYSISLEEPIPIIVTLENTKTVDCFGELSGELVAHVTGGLPSLFDIPYIYKWYKLEIDEDKPEEAKEVLLAGNDSILSGLGAGYYILKVEDSCVPPNTNDEIPEFEITEPPLLEVKYNTRNISCYGGRNGYIHIIEVSGGVGNYKMYCKQENVDTDFLEIPIDSNNVSFAMDTLSAGVYRFYIQDSNQCYAKINGNTETTIELIQPQKPLSIDSVILVNPSKYGASNGSIEVSISGGTPFQDSTYMVVWKNFDDNLEITSETRIENDRFIATAKNLPDGEYFVEVRDMNYYVTSDTVSNEACIAVDSYVLIQPDEFEAFLEEVVVSCNGASDGELKVTAKGGVINSDADALPYKYQWYKKDESGEYVPIEEETSESLIHISGGDYRIDLEDYSWLPNTLSLEWHLVEPEKLKATATQADILCGQTATVSVDVSGGTPPYAYQWSTGNETSVLEDMYPGIYMVFVTDSHGCTTTAISRITSPGDVRLSGVVFNPICYESSNGKVVITVSGGTAPYTYQWSNKSTKKDLTEAKAGIYTVVVKDRDGCAYTESFTLKDPEPVKLSLGGDKILCFGQTYRLEPVCEDPKSTFFWTSDNGFQSTEKQVVLDRAGTYRLTITDSKGCQATDQMTIITKENNISCDMVVSSTVALNDTVVIVNISSPEPDKIEWLFSPDDPIEVLNTTDELAVVIFKKEGEYNVGIRTHVAECFQDLVKPVKVTRNGERPFDGFGVTNIKKFVAYPNPSDGKFHVEVELDKQANIRLRLINVTKGQIMNNKAWNDNDTYSIEYNETAAPGTYLLMLETPSSRRSLKLIVY